MFNIGSGNGMLPDDAKLLLEPISTCFDDVVFYTLGEGNFPVNADVIYHQKSFKLIHLNYNANSNELMIP